MKEKKYYKDKVKYITLADLYLHYRYKWRDVNSTTVPLPYFPKDQVSDHKYKLSYKEWKKVVLTYFECVLMHLAKGYVYKMPMGLGLLQFVKYPNTFIDFEAGRKALKEGRIKKGEFLRKVPFETDGYSFKIKWHKSFKHQIKFKNKWLYSVKMLSTSYRKVWRMYAKDRSLIYNLSDS